MSREKTAAQCIHAVRGLRIPDSEDLVVVVLRPISDSKFEQALTKHSGYVHADLGLTEVEKGTKTAFAFIENN